MLNLGSFQLPNLRRLPEANARNPRLGASLPAPLGQAVASLFSAICNVGVLSSPVAGPALSFPDAVIIGAMALRGPTFLPEESRGLPRKSSGLPREFPGTPGGVPGG